MKRYVVCILLWILEGSLLVEAFNELKMVLLVGGAIICAQLASDIYDDA